MSEIISRSPEEFKKSNRRSFVVAGTGAVLGLLGLGWILNAGDEDGATSAFRGAFRWNEKLSRAFFNADRENSKTAAPVPGTAARVNGDVGLDQPIDLTHWSLRFDSPTLAAPRAMSFADFKNLPRTSSQSEFRCIEGWSQPISYEGVRFSDFLQAVDPSSAAKEFPFVGLETPDAEYYVSVDMESMLHPQTVLADTMNGAPLGAEHGEPLRLIIPVKYGIKNLKRVGRIFLAREQPPDYWAEQGYDWYSGL